MAVPSSRDVLAANLIRYRGDRPVALVAKRAGITRDALHRLERGGRWTTAETLDALADALGTTPARLLTPPPKKVSENPEL